MSGVPVEATAATGLGSRIITCILGVLFFLPVSLYLHNHFDLPIASEVFAGAVVVLTFVLLLFFQSETEEKNSKKRR
jgi:uncharacterized membrane protein